MVAQEETEASCNNISQVLLWIVEAQAEIEGLKLPTINQFKSRLLFRVSSGNEVEEVNFGEGNGLVRDESE
ncbi:hypothetical protein Lal_00016174, partial [Lupinus albus]